MVDKDEQSMVIVCQLCEHRSQRRGAERLKGDGCLLLEPGCQHSHWVGDCRLG